MRCSIHRAPIVRTSVADRLFCSGYELKDERRMAYVSQYLSEVIEIIRQIDEMAI